MKSGGRYQGGWWQRLSPEWRQQIRIDGKPVIEYDYSGMHIVLLYALRGIDYWKDINKDPFDLSEYGYVNDEQMRNLLKVILNCYVNVEKGKKKSKTHAKEAVEFEINSNHDYYSWTKDYIDIGQLMDDFCFYHDSITRYFLRYISWKDGMLRFVMTSYPYILSLKDFFPCDAISLKDVFPRSLKEAIREGCI